MQFSQVFSKNALTPYLTSGDERLLLPPTFTPTDTRATQLAQLVALSGQKDLRFRQRDWHGGLKVWPREDLLATADYGLRDRDGNRPRAMTFPTGLGQYANFHAPLDDRTHTLDGDLSWRSGRSSLTLAYDGSIYDNDVESVTLDNPFASAAGNPLGRVSREPDNSMHRLSLSGAMDLATGMPARVAGTISYGRHLQDESFLPHSANPLGVNPALPQSDLDGRIDRVLANLLFTARPARDLNVRARYRFNSYDDQTDTILFPATVRQDAAAASGPFVSTRRDYRRQTATLEGSYRLSRELRASADVEWDNWYREDRQVTHQNDWAGGLALDYRPRPYATLRTSYEVRSRKGNDYDPGLSDAALRMFDVADRVRHELELVAILIPSPDASVTLNGSFLKTDYDQKSFGLDDVEGWTAGIDGAYQLSEAVSVSAYYTYGWTRYKQDGSSGGGFEGKNTDTANDFGVHADVVLTSRVGARFGWEYHQGRATTKGNGSAVSFPTVKDDLQVVSAMFDYQWRENVRLEFGYRYEHFAGTDFQYDDLGLIPPPSNSTADVLLRNNTDDYDAQILLTSVVYEF